MKVCMEWMQKEEDKLSQSGGWENVCLCVCVCVCVCLIFAFSALLHIARTADSSRTNFPIFPMLL